MKTASMTRREWIDQTKRLLDQWDASLTELESIVGSKKDDVSNDVRAKLVSTRQKLDTARVRWTKAKETAQGVWDNVSDEIAAAWDINRMAVERSIDEVKSAVNE